MKKPTPEFTSDLSHPTLVRFHRLTTDREFRDDEQAYAVEGLRFAFLLAENLSQVAAVIYAPKLLKSNGRRIRALCTAAGVRVIGVPPEVFRKISSARRASGLAFIVKQRLQTEKAVTSGTWIAVRHLRSDGNFGTLIRSADAAGISGMILFGQTLDPFDPNVIRASMGSILNINLVRTTHTRLRERPLQWLGLDADAKETLWEKPLSNTVFLLGHERHGLTDEERELCDSQVRIPMFGSADSLNAAIAGSIVCFEAVRKRIDSR